MPSAEGILSAPDRSPPSFGRIGLVRCEPGWRFEVGRSRALDDYLCWFIWAGEGDLVLPNGGTHALRPGTLCVMRPRQCYEATQNPAHRLGVTYIHVAGLDGPMPPEVSAVPDLVYADSLLRRVVTLARQPQPDPTAAGAALGVAARLFQSFLMDVVLLTQPRATPRDPRSQRAIAAVLRAANRIMEDPANTSSVEDLAAEMAQSKTHFARVFRAVHGRSPKSFMLRARLDRAAQLLREADMPVAEVASIMGYTSPQFFSRQYKAHFGAPPSAARPHSTG